MGELSWLNKSFVQNVLQQTEKDESIKVTSVIVRSATAKGDNFTSDVLRVSVKLSRIHNGHEITESRSLIAKVQPHGDAREEMVSEARLFETEISTMLEILPRINKILTDLNAEPISARCLYVQYEKPVCLIVEDLALAEYRTADRRAGLDLDHCLLALRNLALFHASSVALAEQDPKGIKKFEKGLFHKDQPASIAAFFDLNTKALGEEVANWTELTMCPRISEKILKLSEIAYQRSCRATPLRDDEFKVLIHGDYSANNVMFRYDERQRPIGIKFVDFQFSSYGSPAEDVLVFLGSSPSADVRIYHRQLLLREYHHFLSSTMAKLKCTTEAPSFESLEGMLRRDAFYEVIASFAILQHIVCDKSVIKSMDELMRPNGKFENPAYKGTVFRQIMARTLPLYDSVGLLDV